MSLEIGGYWRWRLRMRGSPELGTSKPKQLPTNERCAQRRALPSRRSTSPLPGATRMKQEGSKMRQENTQSRSPLPLRTMSALVASMLVISYTLPLRAETGVAELAHPVTGEEGFWVPVSVFQAMERSYETLPGIERTLKLRKGEVTSLRLSLKSMTVTATTAQTDATKWEARSDKLFDENLELRLKIPAQGWPWWTNLIALAAGIGLMAGAVSLARPIVAP